ncbi:hypothetical protein P8452_56720 [Trifolium repens]|nr:hypothetical protein P8452_56720 [Trifolium repens]
MHELAPSAPDPRLAPGQQTPQAKLASPGRLAPSPGLVAAPGATPCMLPAACCLLPVEPSPGHALHLLSAEPSPGHISFLQQLVP